MADQHDAQLWWSRRALLKTGAAIAAGAYGMRWGFGRAAEIPL